MLWLPHVGASMSRHDAVLKRAEVFLQGAVSGARCDLIRDLTAALVQEIVAHDETRIERNTSTQRVGTLLGNVRGLETKVSNLQTELESAKRTFFAGDGGATSYAEGYLAGLVAARDAIEALVRQ